MRDAVISIMIFKHIRRAYLIIIFVFTPRNGLDRRGQIWVRGPTMIIGRPSPAMRPIPRRCKRLRLLVLVIVVIVRDRHEMTFASDVSTPRTHLRVSESRCRRLDSI